MWSVLENAFKILFVFAFILYIYFILFAFDILIKMFLILVCLYLSCFEFIETLGYAD